MAYDPTSIRITKPEWSRLGFVSIQFMQGEIYLAQIIAKPDEFREIAEDILKQLPCSTWRERDDKDQPLRCVREHCHIDGNGYCYTHRHSV